jgi:putative redox protein
MATGELPMRGVLLHWASEGACMGQTIEVQVEQIGPSTSKAAARSHSVLVDRPEAKGGADRGPLGGELMLISLGGCFMSNLLAAIRAREAAISAVRVTVTGTTGGSPERFESLQMRVAARTDDRDLLAKLVAIAERSCLVTNTLREATALSILIENPQDQPAALS